VETGHHNGLPAASRAFLFLLASSRPDGNTEQLARAAAAALPPEAGRRWISLRDLPLEPFRDVRHDDDPHYPLPQGSERILLDATLQATDLVVASPLYWYSVSAHAKLYLDHWSRWLRVPDVDFRARMHGRTLWAVTAYSSGDPAHVEPLLGTLRLCADYLGMHWGGELLAAANRPGDVAADPVTLARAARFFSDLPGGAPFPRRLDRAPPGRRPSVL